MFDLPKVLPFKVLSLTQRFLSTAISLALVITPFSSSIANEIHRSTVVELVKNTSLRILYQGSGDKGTNTVAQAISQKERAMIEQFAIENQLTIEWHALEDEWQLMPALINGRGS